MKGGSRTPDIIFDEIFVHKLLYIYFYKLFRINCNNHNPPRISKNQLLLLLLQNSGQCNAMMKAPKKLLNQYYQYTCLIRHKCCEVGLPANTMSINISITNISSVPSGQKATEQFLSDSVTTCHLLTAEQHEQRTGCSSLSLPSTCCTPPSRHPPTTSRYPPAPPQ